MRYRKRKRIYCALLLIISLFNFISCSRNEEESHNIKIYYNKNTVKEINVVEEIIKEYKKKVGKEVTLVGVEKEEDMIKFIGEDKESNIVILDGYSFVDFANKDYLRDISYLYKDKKTREKFSLINNVYGRLLGSYYGIGFMPFSLDLVCNDKLLKSMGLDIKEDNLFKAISILTSKGIKIPTYIKSEYTKELLLSAVVANDTIIYDMNQEYVKGKLENDIYTIKDGQKIFNVINDYYKQGILKESNFIEGGEELIEKFNKGEIPVVLTTTLSSDKFDSSINATLINKQPIENKYVNAATGVDIIICATVGNHQENDVESFLRFLLQGGAMENLNKMKVVTGNKMGDSSLIGVQGDMASSIQAIAELNRFYFNRISNKDILSISDEVKNVMEGKYDGKEWERVLNKKTTQ